MTDIELDINENYTFEISEKTSSEYKISATISQWLKTNLENLTDDHNKKIFGKVNLGFNDTQLKSFGKRPVADVYIDRVEYSSNFDETPPTDVHSIIIFYVNGASDNSYLQCCQLHDYIIQEFIENRLFRCLDNMVLDTFVRDSELMNQPINKKLGVMGAVELTHRLY